MRKTEVTKALLAAGFEKKSYDDGFSLVPCAGCTCIEWVWVEGQVVSRPKGAHKRRVRVRPVSTKKGFSLSQRADGTIVVSGVDPVGVSKELSAVGFVVELVERYGWRAYSTKVRYATAVITGKKEGVQND